MSVKLTDSTEPVRSYFRKYVPSLQNGTFGISDTTASWVAIPLVRLLRIERRISEVETYSDLARILRVPDGARMLLLGIGPDKDIERYWANRLPRTDFPGFLKLARLFDAAIAPNFSFFLDDPRTQHLF